MLGTWIALNSATVPRMRGMVGLLPVLLLFLVVPHEVALAECSDKPKPGVDWSKCQKMRLVLRGQDLGVLNESGQLGFEARRGQNAMQPHATKELFLSRRARFDTKDPAARAVALSGGPDRENNESQ